MTTWHTGIPDQHWDKNLFASGGHFTQSSHWAAVQQALGKKVFYAHSAAWQCLAIIEPGQLGTRLYSPYGPHSTSLAGLDAALSALKQLARQEGAHYIRVEPSVRATKKQLVARGLKSAPKDTQPRYTWVKDLTKTPEEALAEMGSSNRNRHRTAAKRGITFKESRAIGDLPVFLDMIHEVATHTGMKPFSDSYYQAVMGALLPRNAAKICIAIHDGKPVASALAYDSPTTRYYAHAASYSQARQLQPGSSLLSTMIFDAQKNGQKEFDFFGIAPPDEPKHKWAGFSEFKKSFGGHTKTFNGTWELPVRPLRYVAYRMAHTVKRLLP